MGSTNILTLVEIIGLDKVWLLDVFCKRRLTLLLIYNNFIYLSPGIAAITKVIQVLSAGYLSAAHEYFQRTARPGYSRERRCGLIM